MTFRSSAALAALSKFRRDLSEAEKQGCSTPDLIDRAGTIAFTMENAGFTNLIDEARQLSDRALKLKARY